MNHWSENIYQNCECWSVSVSQFSSTFLILFGMSPWIGFSVTLNKWHTKFWTTMIIDIYAYLSIQIWLNWPDLFWLLWRWLYVTTNQWLIYKRVTEWLKNWNGGKSVKSNFHLKFSGSMVESGREMSKISSKIHSKIG